MTRRAWASALGVWVAVAGAAGAQDPGREGEELSAQTRAVVAKLPVPAVRAVVEARLAGWGALDFDARRRVEGWLDAAAAYDPAALERAFAMVAEAIPAEQAARAEMALDALAHSGDAAAAGPRRVVIVIVGGGETAAVSFLTRALAAESAEGPMPRLAGEIRPFGALLTRFDARSVMAEAFFTVLLTGRQAPEFVPSAGNAAKEIAVPTLPELYRMLTKAPARACWTLYRDMNLLADYGRDKRFGDRVAGMPVWGEQLRTRVEPELRDEVIAVRKKEGSALDFPLMLAEVSPKKLKFDTIYGDQVAAAFMQRQAVSAQAPLDSDVFLTRTAAALLQGDDLARLVIVRLGRPVPDPEQGLAPAVMERYGRDTDAHLYTLWRAARDAAGWRGRTYFWLIIEGAPATSSFVAGPGVVPGSTITRAATLPRVVPTVARMLGCDPEQMAHGLEGVSRKPIAELFPGATPEGDKPDPGDVPD